MSDVDAMIEEAAKAMRHHHSSGCARVVSGAPCTCGIVAFATKALESLGLPLATLAALKAGTWQAVPKEPTGDGKHFTLKHNMQRQGAARMWEVTGRQVAGLDMAAEIYRAMLAAAPKPPAGLYEVREDGSVRRVEVDVVEMLQSIITRAYSGRN